MIFTMTVTTTSSKDEDEDEDEMGQVANVHHRVDGQEKGLPLTTDGAATRERGCVLCRRNPTSKLG